jgi:Ribonuclease G/E
MPENKPHASSKKIMNVRRGMALTQKQWAKLFFAMLHKDHFETVNEYLDELPESERKGVENEMARMAKTITMRKGYEWQ